MPASHNEAFSRILIDKALEFSGWNLLDSQQVQFEFHTPTGRADYLLKDRLGRTLCVLEAKREDADPYDAKEQARGYADNLNAPFVILSNGREHWFWNLQRAKEQDAYRIERLPSRDDLERIRFKNLQPPRPLQTEVITPDYLYNLKPDLKLRGYQIRAMDTIARLFDREGRRKFLLEMATGTGKTLLCAALIRRFLVTRNASVCCSSWIASSLPGKPWRTSTSFSASSSRSSTRRRAAPANCSAHLLWWQPSSR
jgi:type I restriction enzyme R subunit